MIETSARVVSADNGTVLVEASAQSGCGGCTSRSVCGVSGLGKYFSNNRKAIEVQCDANVRAGDELQLSMDERRSAQGWIAGLPAAQCAGADRCRHRREA